jgi:hypothetical protein
MKPLESAMHGRLPSQLADGLKGRDGNRFRHDVLESKFRITALEDSWSVYRSSPANTQDLAP